MKNLLIFLFGAVCGSGGTFLWLRGDIKKRLESVEKAAELPFTMGDDANTKKQEKSIRSEKNGTGEQNKSDIPNRTKVKVEYHKIIESVKQGEKPPVPVPILPREEENEINEENEEGMDLKDIPLETFEINSDAFMYDNSNEKVQLIYFSGDKIMSDENGTVISNPALLVGTDWENYVGNYAANTAFVRNPKLVTDYEIYVENGLYSDEYGPLVTD